MNDSQGQTLYPELITAVDRSIELAIYGLCGRPWPLGITIVVRAEA